MPYDKSLDEELFSESVDFEDAKITVSVFSYNNAESKLQISRQIKRASGDWIFAKLGRLSKKEAESISPIINKALEKM
ncbi:MAG TPA: hypothetical protein ENH41_01880 [Candidatus Omnitrophica bacterium]|nr:hypothetical protein [Candidatus Omnitrophota bacterium]